MRIFTAAAVPGIACLSSQIFTIDNTNTNTTCFSSSNSTLPLLNFPKSLRYFNPRSSSSSSFFTTLKASHSPSSISPAANLDIQAGEQPTTDDEISSDDDDCPQPQRQIASPISDDWETARSYLKKGLIYRGTVESFNSGGLRIRFQSLKGFLPFPLLSPSHSCKDPEKSIREIASDLRGSSIAVKVIQADEKTRKLIFSEKDAAWSKYSPLIDAGDVFEARVGTVEDYGAFVHLRFPDG